MRCPLGNTPQCKVNKWQKELHKLRIIILECGLREEFKWGVPCYTVGNKNALLLHGFKEYCAIMFFKGALLKDVSGILVQQTKNVQAARQIRFTNVKEIAKLETVLKKYIYEAVEIEKSGLTVKLKSTDEFDMPEEFQKKMNEQPALKRAFEALTPGRQRGYLLYFSAPKQPKTREARIEKCIPQIFRGKGLNDFVKTNK